VGGTAALLPFPCEDQGMRTHHLPLPLALSLLVLLLGAPARADEVALKGGSRLTGVVLRQDAEGVRLLQAGGDEVRLSAADLREVRIDEDAPRGEHVVRYTTGGKAGPEGLQVGVVHLLHPTTGRRVDLVGAVHIADLAYYREVQRLLEQVDVVLYEMVKSKDAQPEDKPPETPEGEFAPRDFQKRLGEWFGLAFQLDAISYDRPHFVHADLTLEEFTAGSSGGAMGDQLKSVGPMLKMLDGMMRKSTPAMQRSLKGMLGRMMGNLKPEQLGALLGSETFELLIDRRNEACVKRLLELPAETRTVAIFYGAAHLPDLEKRLKALGYERAGARWLTAWDTRAPAEALKEGPAVTPGPK
jgi:hypothetical protein